MTSQLDSKKTEIFKRRRLLVLAASSSDLVEMRDLAKVLAKSGHSVYLKYVCENGTNAVGSDARNVIQFLDRFEGRLQGGAIELSKSFSKQELSNNRDGLSTNVKPLKIFFSNLLGWIRNQQGLRSFLTIPICLFRYVRNLNVFRNEFRQHSYDAILMPEDVVGMIWPIVIKAAHEANIPSLVFPYTLANQQEALQSLRDEPHYQTRNNRLLTWLAPNWRFKKDGLDLMRLPIGHVLAHQLLRVSPPDPWLMNSGYANAICVDSHASCDYFLRSGIPSGKLVVTGSVSQDVLFAEYQHKEERLDVLRRELRLEGNKPLLLISGCPNQLEGKVPFCEFASMGEIAAHLGAALSDLREVYHLVVRPHPNFMGFGELLKPWGVVETTMPTSRLVPLADLFIAFASATIRWAVACAVPTINYDIFHYGYGDFSGASGVQTVTGSEVFVTVLSGMRPDGEAYAAAKVRITADAARWSMTDGRCAERIEAAIDAACSNVRVQRTSR
jgi:hypothetical protein